MTIGVARRSAPLIACIALLAAINDSHLDRIRLNKRTFLARTDKLTGRSHAIDAIGQADRFFLVVHVAERSIKEATFFLLGGQTVSRGRHDAAHAGGFTRLQWHGPERQ